MKIIFVCYYNTVYLVFSNIIHCNK